MNNPIWPLFSFFPTAWVPAFSLDESPSLPSAASQSRGSDARAAARDSGSALPVPLAPVCGGQCCSCPPFHCVRPPSLVNRTAQLCPTVFHLPRGQGCPPTPCRPPGPSPCKVPHCPGPRAGSPGGALRGLATPLPFYLPFLLTPKQ